MLKLSVETADFGSVFTIREFLLRGMSTPMPAMPHVQSFFENGLLVGSKSP